MMFAAAWRLSAIAVFYARRDPILARLGGGWDANVRTGSLVSLRSRQECVDFSCQAVSGETHPFAHGDIGPFQALNADRGKHKSSGSGGTPIDRVGLDR